MEPNLADVAVAFDDVVDEPLLLAEEVRKVVVRVVFTVVVCVVVVVVMY